MQYTHISTVILPNDAIARRGSTRYELAAFSLDTAEPIGRWPVKTIEDQRPGQGAFFPPTLSPESVAWTARGVRVFDRDFELN